MNEKTDEEICGELAIATGYYVIEIQHDGLGWQVVHNSGVFPFATRERCEEFVLKTAPGYLTDWNATGALIEWAIAGGYWFNFVGFGSKPRISAGVTFDQRGTKWGDGATAQEALVRAIYAAIKARAESEEK